jgi:hypothetical protein
VEEDRAPARPRRADVRPRDARVLRESPYTPTRTTSTSTRPDWPIDRPFFIGEVDDGEYDASVAVDVQLDIPDEGIENLPIRLPEYARFRGDLGFQASDTPYWTLTSLESCFDSNGDGSATLDEDAITFSWVPSTVKPEDVVGGRSRRCRPTSSSPSRSSASAGSAARASRRARACACPTTPTTTRPRVDRRSAFRTGCSTSSRRRESSEFGYQAPQGGGRLAGHDDWAVASDNLGYFEIEAHRVTEYAIEHGQGRRRARLRHG